MSAFASSSLQQKFVAGSSEFFNCRGPRPRAWGGGACVHISAHLLKIYFQRTLPNQNLAIRITFHQGLLVSPM